MWASNTISEILGRALQKGRALFSRSQIEAAAPGRRWEGLKTLQAPKQAVLGGRAVVMGRARQLVTSNPLAASGVEAWVSGLVGPGIIGRSAHPSESARRRINTAWARFVRDADADGRLDFYGLQALIVRRLVTDGEALVLMQVRDGQLRLRVLASEQLSDTSKELSSRRRVVSGIEFDASGQRIAYHIFPDAPGALPAMQPVRVDARDVLHVFRPDYPGQIRGLSWLAPVLLTLQEHAKLSDAALMQQQIAAMLTGFVRTPDGDPTKVFDSELPSLEPGSMVALDPSQDVTFSQPPKVDGARDLLKLSARQIAVGLGVPYEILSGDLEAVNYSSIRAGLVEFRRRCEALQYGLLAVQLLDPIFTRFVAVEVLAGRLYAPGRLEPHQAVEWFAPKQAWVDPLKDVQAEIAGIRAGLMSRTEALAQRGWSAEEVDTQIAADRAREQALGLFFGPQQPAGGA
jgi:lambda family phage portal protein